LKNVVVGNRGRPRKDTTSDLKNKKKAKTDNMME
jgi:hypothetical protein